MATKREKRAAALAKRHAFMEETRQRGLKALAKDRERRAHIAAKKAEQKKREDAKAAAKKIAESGINPEQEIDFVTDAEIDRRITKQEFEETGIDLSRNA